MTESVLSFALGKREELFASLRGERHKAARNRSRGFYVTSRQINKVLQ
jgi:hypothetical protein